MSEIVRPSEIERESFRIIGEGLKGRAFDKDHEDIIKRAIHTSADFDYADNLVFSENAVEIMVSALKRGACIVTDTKMAYSGINKKILNDLGGEAFCFISDEDVAKEAEAREITRSMAAVEKAAKLNRELIFAVGNAPTALIKINELYRLGRLRPVGVIGVPVGFVNVVESKELIIGSDIPHIVARGNKGGSNIAAAVCNALLYKIKR